MFDATLRPWIDRPLNGAARRIVARGISADLITLIGFAVGMLAACCIAFGQFMPGVALIAINRVCDGLDGAVARCTSPTDRGGFLDITLDFVFYASIPLAFAIGDPGRNALPAAILLAAFLANGAAFLAFAILAAKRGPAAMVRGRKTFTYMAGLAEGTETIAVFIAVCVWPTAFPVLAFSFACVCMVSAAARILVGYATFAASDCAAPSPEP